MILSRSHLLYLPLNLTDQVQNAVLTGLRQQGHPSRLRKSNTRPYFTVISANVTRLQVTNDQLAR